MQLFLSHAAEDSQIASVLRELIERCSLGKATVWFSSDTSPTGGMTPGGPWFDQLVEKLNASTAFLALVTPSSSSNLWLHYEAGCAAMRRIPIVPLVAGRSVNDLRLPLALYNAHNVAQPSGLKTVLSRLYAANEIPCDAAMLETPIQRAVREITLILDSAPDAGLGSESEAERMLQLIDKRFMDLIESLPATQPGRQRTPTFSVSAVVKKGGKILKKVSLDVSDDHTIQHVADALYFKIEQFVEPFKYLEQWIVRDATLGVNLVMRDFLSHVKANAVIRPGHAYEVILLSHPYDPCKGDRQELS
jgi:hypothetical protein